MVEITNTSRALRGINTEDQATVYLQPGETRDLKVNAAEMAVLDKVAKDYGLFMGSREQAVEALKEEQGEDGDLGSLSVAPTNFEDTSTTDIPQVAATLHPMPADVPLDTPETPMDTTTVSVPWDPAATSGDTGSEAGQGATTGGDDGAAAAPARRTAKARGE